MADMYGAVRSNKFKVKDVEVFKEWFKKNVLFGCDIQVWVYSENTVCFGGCEQYPNAYPNVPAVDEDSFVEPWDLEEFAEAVREHLLPGEELRVLAAGHKKLRYVGATYLVVTHEKVTFTDLYEGN